MADLVDVDALRASFVTCSETGSETGSERGTGTRGGTGAQRRARWVEVEHHASLPSTNARALEAARPGLVVLAEHQSAGRGRLARGWEAPAGSSLLLSATVPVPEPEVGVGWLPLLAGLAVAHAVREVAGVQAALKWPNDVLLPADGHRKVCGVLCEVGGTGPDRVVVVGLGLNLTQERAQLPVDTATSLALAGAADLDGTRVAAAVLAHLASLYDALVAGGEAAAGARAAYRGSCDTLGREVRLQRLGAPDVVGTAVDLDDDGRLVIETPDGARAPWAAGDVVHARPVGAPDPVQP